ncbi:serine carboxypeptidase [Neolentinus lepideus HHB14362 ss-1]|uniref:Carboxypeptidase n=1 Tax=Neolentinus lepideus HHB14362 ss-1 TaxID=1314782 RepID=A0A165RWR1_9AGAM|nr:serine carboxypeptidase [Neolentinus lepideus HHB14362 ss-1]
MQEGCSVPQPSQSLFTLERERLGLGHRINAPSFKNDRTLLKLATFDADSFKPFGQLSALSNEFTTLGHPAFPKYSVRVKKSDFCDGTVAAYTGYIDVEARHLFFYFFESRNDPAEDDVIFWTNGGTLLRNAYYVRECVLTILLAKVPEAPPPSASSWSSPVGVGHSYAEYGETVSTTEEAAVDIAAFVAIFFEHFGLFKNRGFHMAGESYGGRYIPLFASAVYDQNAKLVEAGMTPVNLSSIMIGSAWTDQYKMILSYYDMQCTLASLPPILDISTCVRMSQVVPRCQKRMQASCIDVFDFIGCSEVMAICPAEIQDPFIASGMNLHYLSKPCEGLQCGLCYSRIDTISEYLAQPSLRTALGVDPAVTGNDTTTSRPVEGMFIASNDMLRTSYDHVAALLERGVRVLIYTGTYDWICNWVGNERWVMALERSGRGELAEAELRGWNVDGKEVGKTRSARSLTWATIYGAGHMAPYDKPKESLEMVNRWLAGQEL